MFATTARKPHALLSLFPPPTYLAMPSVGIDISDRTMKYIELCHGKDGQVPTRFGDRPLEAGIITDGKILDSERLKEALLKLKQEHGFLFVRASLPEQQAYVFQSDIPAVESEEQLTQVIEFRLEENIPLPPDEVLLAYDVLGVGKKDEHLSVTVTAYPKENVQRYVDALEGAGLMPLSLEIESQAISRAVVPHGDFGTYLIVDFGETRTGIAIVSSGLLAFTSTVEVRGRDLTEAISKHCTVEGGEIAHIKNEIGIRAHSADPALAEALTKVVSNFTAELERHHAYWNAHAGDNEKIKQVMLCGGNANLAGLPEYVSAALRVPVERANVWVNTFSFEDVVPALQFEDSLSYATAIGLALERVE